ncbi:hypothetical protein [uncultured Sphingomonas sp.]|uniref:hypothetical protein n=1 Tax=uncultured Sphingomonas sp. TaxID=158754 RepID=UPI0035CBF254
MVRLRIFASILAILSLAVAVWAWVGEVAAGIPVALFVAAACLAIVTPFDAPNPARRTRVLIACFAHVAALAAAMALAYFSAAPGALMTALLLLTELGLGLTGWAIATRNRRRMSGSRRYFDN